MPAIDENLPESVALTYDGLGGWEAIDHLAGFSCFLNSANQLVEKLPKRGQIGADPQALRAVGEDALSFAARHRDANGRLKLANSQARQFFETRFEPRRFSAQSFSGFVTGYFEPEVKASRTRHGPYQHALYRRPDDLVKLKGDHRPAGLGPTFEYARKTPDGLVEYYDRKAIQDGALNGKGYELFYLQDPVDVFFIHVQGSARLLLDDGTHTRVGFDGKSGHPYTPIGKVLIARGAIGRKEMSMDALRQWLKENPASMNEVFAHNRSFIFFAEAAGPGGNQSGPVAAAGVALTAGYSLAVDRFLHTFATPVFLRTAMPLPWEKEPFSRLMVAQDTGSAIVGPERGDLFIGSGEEAGKVAGQIAHKADFVFLWPRG